MTASAILLFFHLFAILLSLSLSFSLTIWTESL